MSPEPGGSAHTASVAASTALVGSLGIGDNWGLLALGILLGMFGKAAATLSVGRSYTARDLKIDALMSGMLFFVAAFAVEYWSAHLAPGPSPVGVVFVAICAALAGDRIRPLLARWFVVKASAALGVPGSTADVVQPPAMPSPEIDAAAKALPDD